MTRFLIIRHGETTMNARQDRIRGWLNVPLDPNGRKQAATLGESLKNVALDGLISSDLDRAHETALIISQHTDVPVIGQTLMLRPWNVGQFTGVPSPECREELAEYAMDMPDKDIPGGESFDTFRFRALTALLVLADTFLGKTVGLVTHHRVERLIAAWKENGCPDSFEVHFPTFLQKGVPPGACWVFDMSGSDDDDLHGN